MPSVNRRDLDGRRVKPGVHYSTGDKRLARGAAATTYAKHDCVLATDYSNGFPVVGKADASVAATATGTLLFLIHAVTVAVTAPRLLLSPWVVITGVNTAAATVGDPVYLSDTAGAWSLAAGTVSRVIGRVDKVSATDGVVTLDGSL